MTAAKKTEAAADGGRSDQAGQADAAELGLARQLAERARAEGLQLTEPGGLLGRLTKVVLEGALEGEMDAHLGYARHDPAGRTCQCGLAPLCRRHHRCKQAPGWKLRQPAPGIMRWTTPSGRTYTTTPTRYEL